MPLRDHFHEPLSPSRQWHGFHNAWATAIAFELNRRLPRPYVAEPNVEFGIEVNVAALETARALAGIATEGYAPTIEAPAWAPPAPALTVPFTHTTDVVEVTIHRMEGGSTLVGAIELVSPANKDRSAHREAFTAKCRAYLQEGVGLIVADIVTSRHADLHSDLLSLAALGGGGRLYAAAYRPVDRSGSQQLEVWIEDLKLGASLPTLPLWLRGGPCAPVDLEAAYETTCSGLMIQ